MNTFNQTLNKMKTRILIAAILAGIALSASRGIAGAQVAQFATTSGIIQPNGPGTGGYGPQLSPEEHRILRQEYEALLKQFVDAKAPVALGPQAVAQPNVPETSVASLANEPISLTAPKDFYIGSNQVYSVTGPAGSVAEPSVANSGQNWFATQNWTAGYSTDAGVTWNFVPPVDAGKSPPKRAQIFCCDQDVVHDHGRDVTIWSELFINKQKTNGVVRIYVRSADNLSNACAYDIDGGDGVKYDFPHLGLGNDFLYLTANVLTSGTGWTGAQIWRYNLDQLASCQTVTFNGFTWTGSVGQVIWTPARSTTDTMYMVTIENASQNRYFWWPENSNVISSKVINVPTANFAQATCSGGPSGNNWMEKGATSSVGLTLRSAVGQDNREQYLATYYGAAPTTGRPQAYVAGTIVRTSDMTLLSTPDLFNTNMCMGYADVAANSRGDLGLTVAAGGSLTGGSVVQGFVGISDSYSRGNNRGKFGTIFLAASGDDNPSSYGDYLTARVQEPADTAFIATSYARLAGSTNTHIVEFMRRRYSQAYLDRGKD